MALPAGSRRGSLDSAGGGLPEFLRSMSAAFSRAGSIFSLRSSSSGSVRSPQQLPPVPPNSSAVPALPSDPHNNSASAVATLVHRMRATAIRTGDQRGPRRAQQPVRPCVVGVTPAFDAQAGGIPHSWNHLQDTGRLIWSKKNLRYHPGPKLNPDDPAVEVMAASEWFLVEQRKSGRVAYHDGGDTCAWVGGGEGDAKLRDLFAPLLFVRHERRELRKGRRGR